MFVSYRAWDYAAKHWVQEIRNVTFGSGDMRRLVCAEHLVTRSLSVFDPTGSATLDHQEAFLTYKSPAIMEGILSLKIFRMSPDT